MGPAHLSLVGFPALILFTSGVGSSVWREWDHLRISLFSWMHFVQGLWKEHGWTHTTDLTVFDHCRCVAVTNILPGNLTARLGQCLPRYNCDRVFPYFLALSVLSSFIISLGGTPGLMLLVRCIKPELKSLALGIHTLATRTLAGIPAPIYFGAIIDTTCLKWAYNTCGGRGACRIYNTSSYRIVYLGLTLGLRAVSFFLCIWGFDLLRKHIKREEKEALSNDSGELELLRKEENSSATGGQFLLSPDCNPERETRL